jgi:uncharacterized protein with GYD domain
MPTYVTLLRWTDQGIRDARGSARRLDEQRGAIEQAGGRLIGFWWVEGAHDAISVAEFPDDDPVRTFSLSVANARRYPPGGDAALHARGDAGDRAKAAQT